MCNICCPSQLIPRPFLGYKFVTPDEPPPPDVDDDVRRREEEELQRALEISMQDKGGRSQWEAYSLASSSGASGSGAGGSRQGASATPGPSGSSSRPAQSSTQVPTYGGYVPSQATPAVSAVTQPTSIPSAATNAPPASSSPVSVHSTQDNIPIVTRVRALHTFEPSEPGELAFEKGDIIKVVDRNYKDWWRGQLKGRTGIFPVNYVVRCTHCAGQLHAKGPSCRNPFQNPRRQRSHGRLNRKRLSSPRQRMWTSC